MPVYFDPITLSKEKIDEKTTLYLVPLSDTSYGLRAVSTAINLLSKDSLSSKVLQYWPLDTAELLKKEHDSLIFPHGVLNQAPLSHEIIKTTLGFDPKATQPQQFNKKISEEHNQDGSHDRCLSTQNPYPKNFSPLSLYRPKAPNNCEQQGSPSPDPDNSGNCDSSQHNSSFNLQNSPRFFCPTPRKITQEIDDTLIERIERIERMGASKQS